MKRVTLSLVIVLLFSFFFISETAFAQSKEVNNKNLLKSPPPAPFVNASDALKGALPSFVPGLGTVYVDVSKLPEGPFLAYDKSGNLIKIVFMIPLEELQNQTNYIDQAKNILSNIGDKKIDHVNFIYSGPHPGVEKTHYHFELVIVDVNAEKEALGNDLY